MFLVAGSFGTFVGFLFAGLLALAVTAMLDRSLGKERALLLYTGALLLFSVAMCRPEPLDVNVTTKRLTGVPDDVAQPTLDPFAAPELGLVGPDERNPFRKHSDTRPLPPITLARPPWIALPFELPPPIPGPAPIARHLMLGELPRAERGDGSTLAEMPEATFEEYTAGPEDVYDVVLQAGNRKTFALIRSIAVEGKVYDDGKPGYRDLAYRLSRGSLDDDAEIEVAIVNNAAERLAPEEILRARQENRITVAPDHFEGWRTRRTVANLYDEALRSHRLHPDPSSSTDIEALVAASEEMAAVGRTGKEDKKGWSKAAELLEIARAVAQRDAAPAVHADVLRRLVEAYTALRDEQRVLRVLADYASVSSQRPDPWLQLGRLHQVSLKLPSEALGYFQAALAMDSRSEAALLGAGDALTALGRHKEALEKYRAAGNGPRAKVRVAEAELRLGDLSAAETAARAAEASGTARALLVRGAIQYVKGDLEAAGAAFLQAATSTGGDALRYRAQACYDLGLTFVRLGQADAAIAAFDACEKALLYGSEPQRFPDEAVSPAFGRGVLQLAAGDANAMRAALTEARAEAPGVSYHEVLSGMVGSREGNDAAAARAFERALAGVDLYPNLDGWLAYTRLRLGEAALAAGTPLAEVAREFEAAVAFAQRAAETERRRKAGVSAQLREAWIRLGAEHLPGRRRFESAAAVVQQILDRDDREQPAALAIRAYCNFQLGDYDQCIRDFQLVLDRVPDEEGPWKAWRDYAAAMLEAVKHWRSLVIQTVVFEGTSLPDEWTDSQGKGVKYRLEEGLLEFDGDPDADGDFENPSVVVLNEVLFDARSFEELVLEMKVPRRSTGGTASNNITVGVQVQRSGRAGRQGQAGMGLFYDRGKIAARIGTGKLEHFKDGTVHRLEPEADWPSSEWVEVRFAREKNEDGDDVLNVYLDPEPDDGVTPEPLLSDDLSGFRPGNRGKAQLWIGGWGTQAQEFDVWVRNIRVVRRTDQ